MIPTPEVYSCSNAYETLYLSDYKQPRQLIHMQRKFILFLTSFPHHYLKLSNRQLFDIWVVQEIVKKKFAHFQNLGLTFASCSFCHGTRHTGLWHGLGRRTMGKSASEENGIEFDAVWRDDGQARKRQRSTGWSSACIVLAEMVYFYWRECFTCQVVTLKEAKLLLKEDDDLIIAVYDYWLNKRLRTVSRIGSDFFSAAN